MTVHRLDIPGVLLLYHRQYVARASTVMEHVDAFRRYSRFHVWNVNTELGFPEGLRGCHFETIVLHYSLFGQVPHQLGEEFHAYLDRNRASYTIAFFQDEHHHCRERFAFLNRYDVDCVYSLLEPAHARGVYHGRTSVPKLRYTIPGYVSDELIAKARRFAKPDHERRIDVGYRGRKLAPYMGRGALEKFEIGVGFRERAAGLGLRLDIEAEEHRRIYGDDWYQFLGDCRAVLGVEAGVSIFDLDDVVRAEYERLTGLYPEADFAEVAAPLLREWEGNIPYRTISPRHFEAAALRTGQILFEGAYSGILRPIEHYIPLQKDFSNFDEVLHLLRDAPARQEMVARAHRDLIASGDFSYESFVRGFDQDLRETGLQPEIAPALIRDVDRRLRQGGVHRHLRARARAARHYHFPGRQLLRPLVKPVLARL